MRASTDPVLLMAFAAEVKACRSALEISQEELAFRSEVNRTYVAKLELGQNQPTLSVLVKLAKGLEVEAPELLARTLVRHAKQLRIRKRQTKMAGDLQSR